MVLVDNLMKEGWLKTPRIIKAFSKIKREDFLPEEIKGLAELDTALSIGYGQTISQPLVVAFMLELLQPKEGDNILDIGSGSGWTSCLLAEITGKKGKVYALEVVSKLKEFGENNVSKYNFIKEGRVEFLCADGSEGLKEKSPFDGILVSATAKKVYPALKEQLKIGGKMVLPVGSSIFEFKKKGEEEFEEKEYPGFVFVPLIEK
ncbi:MAG: protein-L-isoaspartate O-methyltransferase [Candidatus Nealsonbacteria bacterium]